MNKVRAALKEAKLNALQCRMAWILYQVNGEANALEFIEKLRRHHESKSHAETERSRS